MARCVGIPNDPLAMEARNVESRIQPWQESRRLVVGVCEPMHRMDPIVRLVRADRSPDPQLRPQTFAEPFDMCAARRVEDRAECFIRSACFTRSLVHVIQDRSITIE